MPNVIQGAAVTVLVILMIAVGGLVSVLDPDELSFDNWLTASLAATAVLGIGRGLAAKGDVKLNPMAGAVERWLEEGNVATVLMYLFAAVGAAAVLTSDALEWSAYFERMLGAAAVLGVGRGLAAWKKDRDPLLRGNADMETRRAIELGDVDDVLSDEETPQPQGAVRGKPGIAGKRSPQEGEV